MPICGQPITGENPWRIIAHFVYTILVPRVWQSGEYNQFIVSSEKWLEIKDTTIFKGLIKCVQDKKINILNDIKNSVVCKSLFLLINIIFYQIESVSENNKKKDSNW